jgi:type IV secretory pathway component VirB8
MIHFKRMLRFCRMLIFGFMLAVCMVIGVAPVIPKRKEQFVIEIKMEEKEKNEDTTLKFTIFDGVV